MDENLLLEMVLAHLPEKFRDYVNKTQGDTKVKLEVAQEYFHIR